MKSMLESFLIAVSMYSAVPVPIVDWNEKNIKRAITFFPFVGVLCAAALFLARAVCRFFESGELLCGVLCAAAVTAVTGGIHLDGFCDTADAVFSRRSKEERLRILKDPNCGPFAVICAVFALILQCAAYSRFYNNLRAMCVMCAVLVMSRAMSGFSITTLKIAPTSSLAKTFGEGVPLGVRVALVIWYIVGAAVCVLAGRIWAAAVIGVTLGVFLWYARMSDRVFGGTTGDVAGYFLVICETAAAALIALLSGRFFV